MIVGVIHVIRFNNALTAELLRHIQFTHLVKNEQIEIKMSKLTFVQPLVSPLLLRETYKPKSVFPLRRNGTPVTASYLAF